MNDMEIARKAIVQKIESLNSELKTEFTGKCENCKWWTGKIPGNIDRNIDPWLEQRLCKSPNIIDGSELKLEELSKLSNDTAFAYNIEAYKSFFITGPAFGCIHFCDKDEKEESARCHHQLRS